MVDRRKMDIIYKGIKSNIEDIIIFLYVFMRYLQLAIRNEQTCLSNGYNFRFIGHANVNDILIL
jgi:hypothetical protein